MPSKEGLECERWQWRELIASEHGPPHPSTRLVLLILSLHMNELGNRCFPSQELIVTRTGLSARSVRSHLKLGESMGWIEIYVKRRKGQAWFNHEYAAIIPPNLAQYCTSKPWERDPAWRRAANSAGRSAQSDSHPANSAERPPTVAQRAANDDTTGGNLCRDAQQPLPPNSPSNTPRNSPNNTSENVQPKAAAPPVAVLIPQDPEAEKRALEAPQRKAAAAEEAAAEERKRKAEERVNRIKLAAKAFPDYTVSELAKVARVTDHEVHEIRRRR